MSQLAIETCVFLSTFKTAVGQCEAACVLCEIIFTRSIWVGCASGILLQIARRFRSFISTPEIEDLVSVSLLKIEDSD